MKKNLIIGLLCSTFILILHFGITAKAVLQGITVNFEDITNGNLPQEFANISNQSMMEKGFRIVTDKSKDTGEILSYFILVQAGQKNTGGYNIQPVLVENVDGKTVITVIETSPNPHLIVTQNLTYPKFVIKIPGNVSSEFVVKDMNGVEFKNLNYNTGVDNKPIVAVKKPINDTKVVAKPNKAKLIDGTFAKIIGRNLIMFSGKKQMKFLVSDNLIKNLKLRNLKIGQKIFVKYIVNKKDNIAQDISNLKK